MRNSKWLVAAGLALVAAFAPGCQSSKCDEVASKKAADGGTHVHAVPTMSAYPGVVEIYRIGEGTVGYVCLDDAEPTSSWWLLNDDETPPVMPRSTVWTDDVEWHQISYDHMNGDQLCARYWPTLKGATLWHVNRGTPMACGASKPGK
jgi:hypothetical protein